MAFTVTETKLLPIVGTEGLALLIGTYTNTAGSTGGEIKPGNNGTNVTGSTGCKKVLAHWYNSTSAAPSEVRGVIAYDAVIDGDKDTITTGADQVGQFFLLCEYAG